MKKIKVVIIISVIVVIYAILIYCTIVFPTIRAVSKFVLFSYAMLIVAIYLIGGIAIHFDKDKNNIWGSIFWYMTWGIVALVPIGIAVIIR